jgi:hypothetical protein
MVEPFPAVTSSPKPPAFPLRRLALECRSLAPIIDPRLSVEYDAATPEKIAVLGPGFMRLAEGPVEEVNELLKAAAGKVLKEAQTELHRKLRVPKRIGLLSGVPSARLLVERFLEVMASRWSTAARL